MNRKTISSEDIGLLAKEVRDGQRRALAKAITLLESSREDHRQASRDLLAMLPAQEANSIRLGVSGPPGAGKSTFIGTFGQEVLRSDRRLAVLAVDPSSPVTGGSILGDKTRMEILSRDERAFIRPSPSGGTLGGATRHMREVILLCEAAGFDFIIVETVGVGQSEVAVAGMVDLVLLLLPPGGGDDLQGIKKGIVEIADMLVVNKADGDLENAANRIARDYRNALHLLRTPENQAPVTVTTCSSYTGKNIPEVLNLIVERIKVMKEKDLLAPKRRQQGLAWMWDEIEFSLRQRFTAHPEVRKLLKKTEAAVMEGKKSPFDAAKMMLSLYS